MKLSKWVRRMGRHDGFENRAIASQGNGEAASPLEHANHGLLNDLVSRLSNWTAPKSRRIVRLAGDEVLVETLQGFYLVIPAWNVDVGIGILRDGIIEPWTNQVFVSLISEGDHIVNVGANFGFFSMLGAQRVGHRGRVYAVEANPVVFSYLLKSMYWAGFPNIVRAYNCAAASPEMHGKEMEFWFDPQFIGGGNMFAGKCDRTQLEECIWSGQNVSQVLDPNRMFIPKGLYSKIKTEGRTLDSFVTDPVKVMLIDAEGSESFVIAGAMEMIRKSPELSIIMEWDPHSYRAGDERKPHIDRMWDFLMNDQKFSVCRICPENYPGIGSFPDLTPLDRQSVFQIPHSDLLLRRRR